MNRLHYKKKYSGNVYDLIEDVKGHYRYKKDGTKYWVNAHDRGGGSKSPVPDKPKVRTDENIEETRARIKKELEQEKIASKERYEKKSMKDIKWAINYHKEKIAEFDEIEDKTYLEYSSSSHHHQQWSIAMEVLRERKDKLDAKKQKLIDDLYDKYPPGSYGMDYPGIDDAMEDIARNRGIEEGSTQWHKLMDVGFWQHDNMDTSLSILNWRDDLKEAIELGDHPELKGKFIPQLGFHASMKRRLPNDIASEINTDLKKEVGIILSKQELNKIKRGVKRHIR